MTDEIRKLLVDVQFAAKVEATAGACDSCDPGNEGADIWGDIYDRVTHALAEPGQPKPPESA